MRPGNAWQGRRRRADTWWRRRASWARDQSEAHQLKEGRMASRGGTNPDFMKQLQQMQGRIAEVQQKLDETIIEASSGGGAVTVKMNAHPSLQEINIKPEVIDPEDAEMLQDLIQAAMNDALEKIRASQMQQLAGLAGGMNLPGLTS